MLLFLYDPSGYQTLQLLRVFVTSIQLNSTQTQQENGGSSSSIFSVKVFA